MHMMLGTVEMEFDRREVAANTCVQTERAIDLHNWETKWRTPHAHSLNTNAESGSGSSFSGQGASADVNTDVPYGTHIDLDINTNTFLSEN